MLIPVLSLGRSQQILYKLKKMQIGGKLSTEIPIYFNGRLAHNYTRLYLKNNGLIKTEMKDFMPDNLIFVNSEIREDLLYSQKTRFTA